MDKKRKITASAVFQSNIVATKEIYLHLLENTLHIILSEQQLTYKKHVKVLPLIVIYSLNFHLLLTSYSWREKSTLHFEIFRFEASFP